MLTAVLVCGVFGQQRDPGPVVVARALAAGATGVPLPGRVGHRRSELVDAPGAGVRGHPPVRRDLHNVAEPVAADRLAQQRIRAVDLVPGDPRCRHTCGHRPGDHRRGKRGLGRELDAVRDARLAAALSVGGPGSRQVQGAIDEGMSTPRRVGQIHRDLGVLDPPGRAGVLPLHPDRVLALLQITGLVNHQDRVRLAERLDHVAAQIVTNAVGVPLRARQQMLQAVRGHTAALLRDRPAVLAVQPGQHPEHQSARVPQRLVPRKPRLDTIQHRAVRHPPTRRIYAMSRGHRGV